MWQSLSDRRQERYAARLLEQAKREVSHSKPQLTARLALGWTLALLVLATPFAVMFAGLGLIWSTYPRIGPAVVGAILLLVGYVLLPPRIRDTQVSYTRQDLPNYYALLDLIAERLGTTVPDRVQFDGTLNAYMAQMGGQFFGPRIWVLGMGFPLWDASTPQERIAHLAHELGHKINNDPMRQGLFWRAEQVLTNWAEMLDPDDQPYEVAAIVQMVLVTLISWVYRLLSGLSFFESQRSEYRADAAASRVSGRAANRSSLEMLTRSDLAQRSILGLYPYRDDQSARLFDHMAAAVSGADEETAARYMSEAIAEKRRVDSSHPPTAMRIEFVTALPDAFEQERLDAAQIDFSGIDQELQPIKHALAREMLQALRDAEFNR